MTASTSSFQDLWQQRYGGASEPAALLANPVIEHLLAHRSVRSYLERPLPAGTLETLLAAAQSAATSSNLQAWSLLAIEDPVRKERLATLANDQAHIRKAPLLLIWLADFSRAQRIAEQRDVHLQAPAYLDSLLVGSIDAALAAQNAVVAAESLGLGTVYIGALRNNLQAVIDELQLPPLVFPVFGLCVGYTDPQQPAAIKPRLPQAVTLHRETYRTEGEPEQIAAYEGTAAAFSRAQGQNTPGWSEQVINRLKGVESLHGRERISHTLNEQGLALR
ncbi:NADPH-dependent oxidoreductase [Pseudomonas daroniae]|uniref:NADPH-dependent oxidoreductase n=1 Tax=Phytopseudomonas daroniae TaxID=2487519 RepID=A0A4Q9QHK9_9GAMM|nr:MULTISPECIES: NADPH-dependent oxidoreductase [Pseudomonas]TBU73515.1 NADPH-dependent oxidoreductase [Pseudomonas daroniae]TBU74794.1 NADPH-dependent oxidoreductase [Pseudomonas daroniae]TBU79980.1 NADPH-dependent oxidoreductase [Pseudomonas sp. FRB 228]TBU88886.1 NADPH-dependent oxidoreductase [Pseudomonas daroniae]